MTDQQIAESKIKILHVPTVLGADVPAYNIPGVNAEVKFTPEVLAGIFLGKITKWDDHSDHQGESGSQTSRIRTSRSCTARMAAVPLTSGRIIFRRSVRSGKSSVGKGTSVKWPVGIGGKGNEGVAGAIRQLPGSLGYIELIYAVQNKIPYGIVRNSSGQFIKASLASTPRQPPA